MLRLCYRPAPLQQQRHNLLPSSLAAHSLPAAVPLSQHMLSAAAAPAPAGGPPAAVNSFPRAAAFPAAFTPDSGSGGGDVAATASDEQSPAAAGGPPQQPLSRMRTRGADKPRPAGPLPIGTRKLGRPILHTGDPDDPSLSKEERRRLRRCAARTRNPTFRAAVVI